MELTRRLIEVELARIGAGMAGLETVEQAERVSADLNHWVKQAGGAPAEVFALHPGLQALVQIGTVEGLRVVGDRLKGFLEILGKNRGEWLKRRGTSFELDVVSGDGESMALFLNGVTVRGVPAALMEDPETGAARFGESGVECFGGYVRITQAVPKGHPGTDVAQRFAKAEGREVPGGDDRAVEASFHEARKRLGIG